MVDKKILYKRSYDNIDVEGRLVDDFDHTNNILGTKHIALIFYPEMISYLIDGETIWKEKLVFRYVEYNDERLHIFDEPAKYQGNTKYDLLKNYCKMEFYIEDNIYNFVNYEGIKI